MTKKLPVGIENFGDFFSQDFYYVDKTGFISELMHNWGKVNLFTRPRRFGKSLNISMLKSFFEIGCDQTIFDGLIISGKKEICDKYMGKFPVICISLKSVDGLTFENACAALRWVIGLEAERFSFLPDSDRLTDREKDRYCALVDIKNGSYTMSYEVLLTSIHTLSLLLYKHYGQKCIILIDEYDVPLDKAFQAGYYNEMVQLLRNFLGNALKTNDSLQFAILTGCLRISKESIFTGLNNLRVNTITDAVYDEYFGFTDQDVKELLAYYHLADHFDKVKAWYDGYQFGNVSVYCPWDVINYCYDARLNSDPEPKNYWVNTSGNDLVRHFINKADHQTRQELEDLISGGSIKKEIRQELTYNELDKTIDNLWSVLFSAGYLTWSTRQEDKALELVIPNLEVRELFVGQIQEWFNENAREDHETLERFCNAFPEENTERIQASLEDYLWNSISIRDTAVRKEIKENFYHGVLLGLLQYKTSWIVKSNAESGEGCSDILLETPERTGVVIELKYAQNNDLEAQCRKALEQIERKKYDVKLIDDGMKKIVKYGIAFYKKQCMVMKGG